MGSAAGRGGEAGEAASRPVYEGGGTADGAPSSDSWANTLDAPVASGLLAGTLSLLAVVVLVAGSLRRRRLGRRLASKLFPHAFAKRRHVSPASSLCEEPSAATAGSAGSPHLPLSGVQKISPSTQSSSLCALGIPGRERGGEGVKSSASFGLEPSALFVSGTRNRSGARLALSFFSSGVGTWILYCPAELSSINGLWPALLYGVAVATPMWILMYAGPLVREEMKRKMTFGLTDYVHQRFGRSMQIFSTVVAFFSLVAAIAGELAFVASAVQTLAPAVPRLAVILAVAATTFSYTAVLGTDASVVTDYFQSCLLPVLLCIVMVASLLYSPVTAAAWRSAATWTPQGAFSGALTVLSCSPAYAMDQGMWQRVLSARETRDVRLGLLGGSLLVLPTVMLLGMTGILATATARALEAEGFDVKEELLGSAPFFFLVLPSLRRGLVALVLVIAVILSASTIDTFQSALPSLVAKELRVRGCSVGWSRLVPLLANVPAVILAYSWSESIIQLFLIGNLLTAALFPPVFLGFWRRTTTLGSVAGFLCGIFSIFLSGLIFASGDLALAARWFTLPLGMGDPSATYTFLIVPGVAAVVTLGVSLLQRPSSS
ncbi:transporter, solute:sodium symporter (SSS) family protein [Besnoitia besnoiti]|uniref:Transporter, solute:sodium symporter (SSS) family protein n=1 Tax=Besnoitia besnoiti TaxID=94643 RepID=A0A2A9MEW9_BESBE|nr:transporter, solute:sodium symporter (SSS) family protein [Besnoitia besnoiti]PFH33932.1 transporter, solute:sodium symporter (SSS) family protein [Besnoitia besnoiti]